MRLREVTVRQLRRRHTNQCLRHPSGFVCLEVGIVLTSLTLLTRRKLFWQLDGLAGLVGLANAASGLWVKQLGGSMEGCVRLLSVARHAKSY
jgi:hypothetical protein